MATTPSSKSVLDRLHRERKRLFDERVRLEQAQTRDLQRRAARGGRMQRRMLTKALQAGGLDVERLDQLHAQDNAAAERFLESHVKKVTRAGVSTAKRRGRQCTAMHRFLRRHFKAGGGNPRLNVALKTATAITVNGGVYGAAEVGPTQISKGTWDNQLRTHLRSGSHSNWGVIDYVIYYDFVWQSTVTGIAEATAWLDFNGTYSLHGDGGCIGHRYATASLKVDLAVAQAQAGSAVVEPGPLAATLCDDSVNAGCTSSNRSGVLDPVTFRTIVKPTIPIAAGLTTIVSVMAAIKCNADEDARASIEADGQSLFGLNVPGVFLVIDY